METCKFYCAQTIPPQNLGAFLYTERINRFYHMKSFIKYYTESRVKLAEIESMFVADKVDKIASNQWAKKTTVRELRWLYNPQNGRGYFFNSYDWLHATVANALRDEYSKEFDPTTRLYAGMAERAIKGSKNDILLYLDHSYEWFPKIKSYVLRPSPTQITLPDVKNILHSVFTAIPAGLRINQVPEFRYALVAFTESQLEAVGLPVSNNTRIKLMQNSSIMT